MSDTGLAASWPFDLKPPSTAYRIGRRIAAATTSRMTYAIVPVAVRRAPFSRAISATVGSAPTVVEARVVIGSSVVSRHGAVDVAAQHEPLIEQGHHEGAQE